MDFQGPIAVSAKTTGANFGIAEGKWTEKAIGGENEEKFGGHGCGAEQDGQPGQSEPADPIRSVPFSLI